MKFYKLNSIEKNQSEKSVELTESDMDYLYAGLEDMLVNLQYEDNLEYREEIGNKIKMVMSKLEAV